jgi:SAM-dependent methyltransferase
MANLLFAELKSRVVVSEAQGELHESHSIKRCAYADPVYWEERYISGKNEESLFEWLLSWQELETILAPELQQCGAVEGTILHPGCGNSTLGTDMRKAGFGIKGILNTDISPTVILMMKKLYSDCLYEVDDALNMTTATELADLIPFNAVVDKGTLDAFTCTDSIAMKKKTVNQYLSEVHRLLDPYGRFILISFGQPETRMQFFNPAQWKLCGDIRTIRNGAQSTNDRKQNYFVYVFEKVMPTITA